MKANCLFRFGALSLVAILFLGASPAEAGDWLVRLRAINIDPDSSSSAVRSNNTDIAGSGVSVADDTIPELDITYMPNPNLGFELVLGTAKHDVFGEGSLASLGKIADSRILPPTLLAQYHFAPNATVRPYIGAGVNFTMFFDSDATDGFEAAAGGTSDVDMDDSVGFAGQVGVDIGTGDWFFNIDVKYVQIETTATITTPGALGVVDVDVDINPLILGVGFGRKF